MSNISHNLSRFCQLEDLAPWQEACTPFSRWLLKKSDHHFSENRWKQITHNNHLPAIPKNYHWLFSDDPSSIKWLQVCQKDTLTMVCMLNMCMLKKREQVKGPCAWHGRELRALREAVVVAQGHEILKRPGWTAPDFWKDRADKRYPGSQPDNWSWMKLFIVEIYDKSASWKNTQIRERCEPRTGKSPLRSCSFVGDTCSVFQPQNLSESINNHKKGWLSSLVQLASESEMSFCHSRFLARTRHCIFGHQTVCIGFQSINGPAFS